MFSTWKKPESKFTIIRSRLPVNITSQIARFMGPRWGPPGGHWAHLGPGGPQVGPKVGPMNLDIWVVGTSPGSSKVNRIIYRVTTMADVGMPGVPRKDVLPKWAITHKQQCDATIVSFHEFGNIICYKMLGNLLNFICRRASTCIQRYLSIYTDSWYHSVALHLNAFSQYDGDHYIYRNTGWRIVFMWLILQYNSSVD